MGKTQMKTLLEGMSSVGGAIAGRSRDGTAVESVGLVKQTFWGC